MVNLVLVSAVLAAAEQAVLRLIVDNVRQTTRPSLMTSAALMLVVLWERSPLLSVALVGPLLAIALYQRSTFKAIRAMRLALTDPLTGLGNHRHFHERLQIELAKAEEEGLTLSLCLVDIDDFKRINDRYGHPVGDRVLGQVASRLRQGGESFRLGGDEFAVMLPGLDERAAVAVARSIVQRVRTVELAQIGPVTVRAGVAAYRRASARRADPPRATALYRAKEDGKNRARACQRRQPSSRSSSSSRKGLTVPRATAPRRAWRRLSTRATSTPAATPSASASSPRGSHAGSASTSRRSS